MLPTSGNFLRVAPELMPSMQTPVSKLMIASVIEEDESDTVSVSDYMAYIVEEPTP